MKKTAVSVHPSAVIMPGAELDTGVEVGPYAVIGSWVRIGKNTWIGPHAVIEGHTTIGSENRIFQCASVGAIPQDKKYRGEESVLVIGDHNVIREFATLHPGTAGGGAVTRIGNHNLFMAYAHVAHDCLIGNHVIMANCATLGGHVVLEDYVGVGGLVGIHQFVRIGESAYLGGGSMVSLDVPPYCLVNGNRAHLFGLNTVGLKRRGFSPRQLATLRKAYHTLFTEGLLLKDALEKLNHESLSDSSEVAHLVEFISASKRGICRPRGDTPQEHEEGGE